MAYPPGYRPLAKGEVELPTEGGVMANRFLANFANKAAAYTSALCAFIVVLGAPILSAQTKPGWQVAWDKTVKAAEKEGQLNIYFTLGPHRVVEDFQKAYPKIKVVGVFGRSSGLVQRILTERRAGMHLADVRVGGGGRHIVNLIKNGMSDPIKPLLILPEVVDKSKWWEGKHRYPDPQQKYFFAFIGAPQMGSISYNTQLVKPKEVSSFWDLLDPDWKGKMVSRDPRETGPGGGAMRFFYHSPKLGPKFLTRLFSEMNITLNRSERQATDWLAIGRFTICFFCRGIPVAKRQGLPVDKFGLMKEGAGLTSQGGMVSLINKAPHPNAARVFINWLLSREGQMAYQKAADKMGSAADSLRVDIPKDLVQPKDRRKEGVTYLDVDRPERRDMKPILKVFEKALAMARKK